LKLEKRKIDVISLFGGGWAYCESWSEKNIYLLPELLFRF
jgi:hypothetical protein